MKLGGIYINLEGSIRNICFYSNAKVYLETFYFIYLFIYLFIFIFATAATLETF